EYESVEVGEEGLLIPQLGLRLGLWQGCFENIERLWLRWFTASGELILTQGEEAEAAQVKVTQAEQRAQRLAAKLRELNIDPDELA
ncbi:MAG: Uma2 family endonuclease, partial [Potamolinea sp.]